MKKFFEISKTPIVIGTVAAILFCVDSILAKYVWSLCDIDSGFIWVAFVAWTISFSMKNEDRLRMWIGHFIGFGAAVCMIYFGKIFTLNVLGISISILVAVFLFDFLVMYFEHLKKFWLNSITGIFMGLFLTFSGLGVGLSPDTFGNAGLMLGIILLYSLLGCISAFVAVFFMSKWKKEPKQKAEKTIE